MTAWTLARLTVGVALLLAALWWHAGAIECAYPFSLDCQAAFDAWADAAAVRP